MTLHVEYSKAIEQRLVTNTEARAVFFSHGVNSCQVCHWRPPTQGVFRDAGLHVHHILARSDGGSNRMGNRVLLCACCHDVAHAIWEWPQTELRRRDFIKHMLKVVRYR